jgi:hypothetical protein
MLFTFISCAALASPRDTNDFGLYGSPTSERGNRTWASAANLDGRDWRLASRAMK